MFDSLVDATTGTSGARALSAWARVENGASARRVAAMAAMLETAYAASGSADRDQWCLDNFDAVAAHIGAAVRITPGAASHQLLIAVALHERFPQVAAVFADGLITYQLIRAVVQRGALVVDPDALHALDALLAEAFRTWEPMSVDKTEKTLDAYVAQVDPHAVRRTETKARSRSVEVHVDEDGSGMATVYATLFAHDAKAFEARLRKLADTVCPADPRTAEQRRADAIGTLASGNDRLACLCGTEDCPAAQNPPATAVVVYVIASTDTITTPPALETPLDGEQPPLFDKPLRDLTLTEALTPTPGTLASLRPAAMIGGQFLPGAIACRATIGATITPIVHPGHAPPEPRYRPSKKLADFVRCRDQTCRFPGCRAPATNCDLDHTIPWPQGPTAASNLKCLCRRHHLLKTFWGGQNGWRDEQLDDGTVIWTAPDGRQHVTTPGSRLLFPELSAPTATVTATGRATPHTAGLSMPRRTTTRTQDHAARIAAERQLNEADDEPDPERRHCAEGPAGS
ncbi:HNH endonuclease [Mycolicibacterium sp. P1-18]|uniref:HNH endonuclease signature motif containing protein n=1 Tax=Mycolicibacterium sp. P1-18 TaxID=2024615 RepID=UPI0011F1919D|nr:HNH endonuclease signature motif containing protein [Mycolicibacterium sp. P1-18]KAA0097934.1 HNH endonuclease [Mycolicibacterium sp. P1-18]